MQKYSELVYNLISLKANERLYFRQPRFSIRKLYIQWRNKKSSTPGKTPEGIHTSLTPVLNRQNSTRDDFSNINQSSSSDNIQTTGRKLQLVAQSCRTPLVYHQRRITPALFFTEESRFLLISLFDTAISQFVYYITYIICLLLT